jgi:hypothetical protein
LLRNVTGLQRSVPDAVACCLDPATGACGSAAATDAMCEAPAIADARCPGIDLSALAALVGGLGDKAAAAKVGCCTQGGMCGCDGALFGRGCVENSAVKSMLGSVPVIGPLVKVPAPMACAEEPVMHKVPNDGADSGV